MVTPDPDYDISPLNSLDNTNNQLIDKDKIESEHIPVRQHTDIPTKSSSSVAIKIGEYTDRKEPCKLHFISKLGDKESNGDVNSQLKNELEKTLSKLNFQSKKEAMVTYLFFTLIYLAGCNIRFNRFTLGKRRKRCSVIERSRALAQRNSVSKIDIKC